MHQTKIGQFFKRSTSSSSPQKEADTSSPPAKKQRRRIRQLSESPSPEREANEVKDISPVTTNGNTIGKTNGKELSKSPEKNEDSKTDIKNESSKNSKKKSSPIKKERSESPEADNDKSSPSPEKSKGKNKNGVSAKSNGKAKASSSSLKKEKSPDAKAAETNGNEKASSKSPESSKKKNSPDAKTTIMKPKEEAKPVKGWNNDYNPGKKNYHPIDDASWEKDQKVPYLALARTLEIIEDTSSRLRVIEILANYLRSVIVLSPDDLLYSVYLCLNKLAPADEGVELGIAEGSLMKAICQATGRSLDRIKADAAAQGDLGLVAESSRSNQKTLFQPAPLTIRSVFQKLKDIALMTGHACQSKKISMITSMLVACKFSEARYLTRSLTGKLRIGLAEQSLLQALAQACFLTPPDQDRSVWPPKVIQAGKKMSAEGLKSRIDEEAFKLKSAFCECPNYDIMIDALLKHGVDDLPNYCKLTPGIPPRPMLAQPTKGVNDVLERFGQIKFVCEYKYDGERCQIHLLEDGSVRIFSRNQENNTSKYPDIISRFQACIKNSSVTSCILDSEAVAWDKENQSILPFQVLSTRKRKDANEADIKVQVFIFAFDLLYLNGEKLIKKPLLERRELLRKHFETVPGEFGFATDLVTDSMEEVQEFLEESIKGNCEGLMVKTLEENASYELAKRSHKWLKLKKDYLEHGGDSLDLVVIGGFHGKGKRAGSYGGYLLACYDPDNESFQTICKLGTGFTDEQLAQLSNDLKPHVIAKPKSYFRFNSQLTPDEWFEPVKVWEVKCADLSLSPVHTAAEGIVDSQKGISLRFPRFIRLRDDKKVEDATSASQVALMYRNQDQVKNKEKKSTAGDDDDEFY